MQNPGGAFALDPDHHPVGAHEIPDRGALAQELGVGCDVERPGRAMLRYELADLAAGADRNGRLHHDDLVAVVHRPGDLFRGLADALEIGLAVAMTPGGSDRDEHGLRTGDRFLDLGGKREPPGVDVRFDQGFEAGLVDRNVSAAQLSGLFAGIAVDADHVDAELRKAGAGYQTDITRTDHSDAHRLTFTPGLSVGLRDGSANPADIGDAALCHAPRVRAIEPRPSPVQLPSRISFAWLILAAR